LTYSQNVANVDYRESKFISSLSGLITVIIIKFASRITHVFVSLPGNSVVGE